MPPSVALGSATRNASLVARANLRFATPTCPLVQIVDLFGTDFTFGARATCDRSRVARTCYIAMPNKSSICTPCPNKCTYGARRFVRARARRSDTMLRFVCGPICKQNAALAWHHRRYTSLLAIVFTFGDAFCFTSGEAKCNC